MGGLLWFIYVDVGATNEFMFRDSVYKVKLHVLRGAGDCTPAWQESLPTLELDSLVLQAGNNVLSTKRHILKDELDGDRCRRRWQFVPVMISDTVNSIQFHVSAVYTYEGERRHVDTTLSLIRLTGKEWDVED